MKHLFAVFTLAATLAPLYSIAKQTEQELKPLCSDESGKTLGYKSLGDHLYVLIKETQKIKLCKTSMDFKQSTCIELKELKKITNEPPAKFFVNLDALYIGLASVGIWKVNLNTLAEDEKFAQNLNQSLALIESQKPKPQGDLLIDDVKPNKIIIRLGSRVFETELDGTFRTALEK